MSRKRDKWVSPGSVLPYPPVAINPGTLLEFYLYPMARSDLPLGNIQVIFITIYDPPGQSPVNFSNVARQKPLRIIFASPQ